MATSRPKLTYMPGRGLSETIRLSFSAAQIEFDEVHLRSKEEYLQLIKDEKLLFQQIPLVEWDGMNLVGSMPIVRLILKRANMQGRPEDQAQIEMLAMGARDLATLPIFAKFLGSKEAEAAQYEKAITKGKERYFPVFEKVLSESKSGFLVGDSMTMADIVFFDGVTHYTDTTEPDLRPVLNDFPKCREFVEFFSGQPGIKEYLASPRRHPAPTDAYAKECINILF